VKLRDVVMSVRHCVVKSVLRGVRLHADGDLVQHASEVHLVNLLVWPPLVSREFFVMRSAEIKAFPREGELPHLCLPNQAFTEQLVASLPKVLVVRLVAANREAEPVREVRKFINLLCP
jgi:hypothetical protein